MERTIICDCGRTTAVQEDVVGPVVCECGAGLVVPEAGESPPQTIIPAESPSPESPPPQGERKPPEVLPEVIAPTAVSVRSGRGTRSKRHKDHMVTLTPEALWIQDVWQVRRLALCDLQVQKGTRHGELVLTLSQAESPGETLTLTFENTADRERWLERTQTWQARLDLDAPPVSRDVPEGVALVREAPDVPHVDLGRVSFVHGTPQRVDRGAQVRAAMRGADAIIDLARSKVPEMGAGAFSRQRVGHPHREFRRPEASAMEMVRRGDDLSLRAHAPCRPA